MSLRTFFKSRAGKSILGIVAAFNTLSFVSSADQWSEIHRMVRESGAKIEDTKGAVMLAALTPTLNGFNPILREGRPDRIFEAGATLNDWLDNLVIAANEPFMGYNKAQMVGLGVMIADNVISFPGAMLGAAAGYNGEKVIHRAPPPPRHSMSTLPP